MFFKTRKVKTDHLAKVRARRAQRKGLMLGKKQKGRKSEAQLSTVRSKNLSLPL
jgi:hypothetical protein